MRLSPLAAVVFACVLFLTACGGDGSDPESGDQSSAPSTDPASSDATGRASRRSLNAPDPGPDTLCRRIEAEQVSELVGADLERGANDGASCTFTDPANPEGFTVTLGQQAIDNVGGAKVFEERLDGLLDAGTGEEVPDVGDRAIVSVQPFGSDRALVDGIVLADDAVVAVGLAAESGADEDESKQQVIELMKIAVAAVG